MTLPRPKRHELGFADYPFFRSLSTELCQEIYNSSRVRQYNRREQIRGMTLRNGDAVHVLLNNGIAAEELVHHEATTLRFRYQGHCLGDSEVFTDSKPPLAIAVTKTVTMAVPLDVMRGLVRKHNTLMRTVSTSMAERLRSNDRVYMMFARAPEQRLCELFIELIDKTGYPTREGTRVDGPSQNDLAQALMVSRATVENTLRSLRARQLVRTEYRAFVFPDVAALQKVASAVPPAVVAPTAGPRMTD
ncbi:Crp/Fnr family transcriptional regulator [Streptomyces hydrogenans]|uniref:Crp/Fnr family transcriptional regulator n=1 Tax=Streptomyces hydrogenans TaxID=1873719 RepID=UPI0035D8F909